MFALPSAIPPGHDPLLGTVLERRYRVLERIGAGGMGTVYLVEHIGLGRKLALKVLKDDVGERPDIVARFMREARAASAIDHPNVVEVVDTGTLPSGSAYYVMEYLQGEDLARTLRRDGRLPWSRVRHLALQICDALAAAHDRGIVHRDLKPANCLRIPRPPDPDAVKILDFGIAKLLDSESGPLTSTGELLGTALYMAPEQAMGEAIDARVDVYALGVMLYQLLSNVHPFSGRTSIETLYAVLNRTPQALCDAAPGLVLPDGVEELVARAMHRERALRFGSMRELAAALTAIPGAAHVDDTTHSEDTRAPLATQPMARADAMAASAVFAMTELAAGPETQQAVEPLPEPQSVVLPLSVPETMAQPAPRRRPRPWLIAPLALLLSAMAIMMYLRWPGESSPLTAPANASLPEEPSIPVATPPQPTASTSNPSTTTNPEQPAVTPSVVEPPAKKTPVVTAKVSTTAKRPTPPRTSTTVAAELRTIFNKQIRTRCHTAFMAETLHLDLQIAAGTGNYTRCAVLPPNDLDAVASCITKILRDKKNTIRPFTGADFVANDYTVKLTPK